MIQLGALSYAIAVVAWLPLALLMLVSWRGQPEGMRLVAAAFATGIWAAAAAMQGAGLLAVEVVYVGEAIRNAAWLIVLAHLAGSAAPAILRRAVVLFAAAACALSILWPLLPALGVPADMLTMLMPRTGLLAALLVLVLLEQIYRNATLGRRRSLHYFVFGVGGVFAYDLFLYSQVELLREMSADAWAARGLVSACVVPLLALAVRRNPQWSLDLFVSRQAVFYTAGLLSLGAYLLLMAAGGLVVRTIGGTWGGMFQVAFLAGAVAVLVSLVSSGALRRRARVFISKHFYRNKYDYRLEWLRFIETLSAPPEEADVRVTSIQAIAQIFDSPGGVLYTLDDSGSSFLPQAKWPEEFAPGIEFTELAADSDLVRFLARRQWIVDLQEHRRSPDTYENIEFPSWATQPGLRIISPLLAQDRLLGFVVLCDPPPPFELTYEDRDLLKTVGRHVATHIAQHEANRQLAESRQFETLNRLTAFLMHDLKNSIAQLKLVVGNAARHKSNPRFVDDMIDTIGNAAERMTRMVDQLHGKIPGSAARNTDVYQIVRAAAERCSIRAPQPTLRIQEGSAIVCADPDRLTAVIEHVIRNAQEATPAGGTVTVQVQAAADSVTLTVADSGSGMSPLFVRERLFKPFDTTKGSRGMGIGAYQAREYVRTLGGGVKVQSSPGAGTVFSIILPLADESRLRQRLTVPWPSSHSSHHSQ